MSNYGKRGGVEGKQRGSPGGPPQPAPCRDLPEGSIRPCRRTAKRPRAFAGIIALTVLGGVPHPQDANHPGRLVHLVNDDVGWHGGQLAGAGRPAGPALRRRDDQAVGRGDQGPGDPHRRSLVALGKPGCDAALVVARRSPPGNPQAAGDTAS